MERPGPQRARASQGENDMKRAAVFVGAFVVLMLVTSCAAKKVIVDPRSCEKIDSGRMVCDEA